MTATNRRVGLDTSFVLRLLVGEPAAQARRATAQLDALREANQKAAVSDLVVTETYFALQYHYEVPKQLALDTLKEFLESPEVASAGEALEVLLEPSLGRANPGFVDRLIHANYAKTAASMLTFEKAAGKLPGARVC